MPLIEAHFIHNGIADNDSLLHYGPTLQVVISGHDIKEAPHNNNSRNVPALVDSGASMSCIDETLAQELGLRPIDICTISGAGGVKQHTVYLAHMVIPELDLVQYGKFTGVHLKAGGQLQEALLGRDFLNKVVMIYDGIRAQVTIASPKL